VEREVLFSGIGGQGVQFAASLLAHAAVAEGRHVQLFGSYGGMMRGGNTEATLIVADMPVAGPPTVGGAWSAILLHHAFWSGVRDRLNEDSILVANTTVIPGEETIGPWTAVGVPAGELAALVGNVTGAAMAALGGYAAATSLVSLDALLAELPKLLPARRSRHLAASQDLLRLGHGHVGALKTELCDAWRTP
jgi:Pyruvate/2-oxoacid:ferredoxin oxidoreductase gamma subunit